MRSRLELCTNQFMTRKQEKYSVPCVRDEMTANSTNDLLQIRVVLSEKSR